MIGDRDVYDPAILVREDAEQETRVGTSRSYDEKSRRPRFAGGGGDWRGTCATSAVLVCRLAHRGEATMPSVFKLPSLSP